ncbi:MAG: hypothetical protein JG781_1390 [Peptococcaceae bacterium]|nr:hypothetical protein [Peptococcaceae bacterium]
MLNYFYPLIIAFCVALFGTPLVKRLAYKIKAVDKPAARKVHQKLMPRLGGLAICIGFWTALLLTQEMTREIYALLGGGLLIILVGIGDDIKGVSPKTKLLVQVLAACIVLAAGVRVNFMTHPIDGVIDLGYLGYPLTVLWIIGVTNAVNLIDGLDGLAAGVSAIAAVTLGIVSLIEGVTAMAFIPFILAASILGFLKYNFHPAQIFMGDTGSLFLGFNLATIAIIGLTKSATVISLFLPIVILGIPIMDTLFAIIRRYHNGKPIFSADKDHLHHRLLALGLSHRHTVLAIYGVSLLLGVSAVLMALVTTAQGMLIMVVTTLGVFIGAERVGILRGRDLKDAKHKKAYNTVAK